MECCHPVPMGQIHFFAGRFTPGYFQPVGDPSVMFEISTGETVTSYSHPSTKPVPS